ncbi:unnamed protein product [Polarella glacialis]|uniref:Uncharacterized protein n=1 Tax=Polarella glacialis TaxID=89957 RepID=A0A813KXP9_POLGL|nr:unnamed protein product [Polarella glacialis]
MFSLATVTNVQVLQTSMPEQGYETTLSFRTPAAMSYSESTNERYMPKQASQLQLRFLPLATGIGRKTKGSHQNKQLSLKPFSFALASNAPPVTATRSEEIGSILIRKELLQVQ